LRAGLPVLTRAGRGFASRVAGSLLTAAGLPELITDSPEDYQALALGLCRDRRLLAGYREHLAVDGKSSALFDCERFTRNLEGAYATMGERWTAGRPRAPLTVSDVGPSRQRPS
jgi:predicted O-linked N-acetylglucosamine transferase (SPINDLY family)